MNKQKITAMNKKFLLVSVVTLLLGTTNVWADNHKMNDGPQKPKKEMVQKNNKKDNKKDKVSNNHRPDAHTAKPASKPAPKPVAHKAPAKPKPVAHVSHKPHHKPAPKPACCPDGRHGKSCHHCHSGHHHNGCHCRPLPPRPVKQVRITPPFSPIQVTVRI
jgi:outer membrane biosynthesis protein TonB